MADCRIYLFTYNRNDLLVRAVESLQKQTFTNWVCELHNDMPGNIFPKELLESLNDERFILKEHEVNLGAIASFNLAFNNCREEYVSILEDDNWWEPTFLEVMINTLNANKHVQMAWANMYLWKEESNNQWVNTNKTIWPDITIGSTTPFYLPYYKNALDPLHSNSAMLIRNKDLTRMKMPLNMRLDFIEHVKERAFIHPILLINQPLANFSITIYTNRDFNNIGTYEHYLLLLSSYFKYFTLDDQTLQALWDLIRQSTVKTSNKLIYTGIIDKNCRRLLKKATLYDWAFFLAYNLKHPKTCYSCLKAKKNYKELWEYLDTNTRLRFAESNMEGYRKNSEQVYTYH